MKICGTLGVQFACRTNPTKRFHSYWGWGGAAASDGLEGSLDGIALELIRNAPLGSVEVECSQDDALERR